MSMLLAMSGEYDRSYFVKSTDASLAQRVLVRLSTPFMIPKLLLSSVFTRKDNNMMTQQKTKFTGQVNCWTSEQLEFMEIKKLSKSMGVTINDLVMCAITTSLGKIFKEKKDPAEKIQILIPANIRFAFYPTREDVKLENKFAGIPLQVPLTQDMQSAYPQI